MLCWELEQRLSGSSLHLDVSVALENVKRSFSVPSVWVSLASAVPLLFLHLMLHFSGCSPVLPAELRSNHTHLQKKNPKNPSAPQGEKSPGSSLPVCAPAEISTLWRRLDVGWEVLLLHCALQWWHTWGKASRVSSVTAWLSLDLREDEQLQTGWVVHSPGVWGLCSSPCPHPFLLLLPAATVFLQCWMEHTLLADRGHHPQRFCAQAGVRRH